MSADSSADQLDRMQALLARHEVDLRSLVRHESGAPLLRFETVDDLLQGVRLHALRRADRFDHRSADEARSWLLQLARRFLRDRRAHWFSVKRGGGQVLRYTIHRSTDADESLPELVDNARGPRTLAERRDQLMKLTRALALLLPRDREVVQWISEGCDTRELAEKLEIGLAAAEKVRSRAFQRLRRTWKLVRQFHEQKASPDPSR